MKNVFGILLCLIMLFFCGMNVYAEDTTGMEELIMEESENAEMLVESENLPCPYTLYIMAVHTTITKDEEEKIIMGVQVYCTVTMQEISTEFYLQQETSKGWVTIGGITVTSEDVGHHVKVVTVSHAPSGNYRVKTVNKVRDYNGFAESETGLSPEMYYYNPDL